MKLKTFNWRWLLMLVVAISLSTTVTACGDDDDEPKQEQKDNDDPEDGPSSSTMKGRLVGYWTWHDNYDDTYEWCRFNANGTGWMYGEDRRGTDAEHFDDYRVRYDSDIDGYCLEIKWVGDRTWELEGEIFIRDDVFGINYGSGDWDYFYREE